MNLHTVSTIVAALIISVAAISPEFGYPPGVDVWCGKAYRSTNASFEPGGVLEAPQLSPSPLLYLSIRPRMSLYVASETSGSFIIDAPLSFMHGQSFVSSTSNQQVNDANPSTKLFIAVSVLDSGLELVTGCNITVNSTSNELAFSLSALAPRLEPYDIIIMANSDDGAQFLTASTELLYLPERTDGGSVVKIDNLYGGLQVQDYLKNASEWTPLFPYTFYTSSSWFMQSIDMVKFFKDQGYNIIHLIPNGGLEDQAFNYTELDRFLDVMDEIELWLMFDMRHTYKNNTAVASQVNRLKSRKSLLLWYTADEPDGVVDPLNATKISYDTIKSLDPYHPVSLCLNCRNFHFSEYTLGTDIIMSDPYPIGINATFSTQFGTVCNSTYGDCGCDGCSGNLADISRQLDAFTEYQEWLGVSPKPQWGVPQAFGNETYWSRYPTAAEEVVMNMIFIHHGAKGIAMWNYPTTVELANITSDLGKLLTLTEVSKYLLGSHPQPITITSIDNADAAMWRVGNSALVSVVYIGYADVLATNVSLNLDLGVSITSVSKVFWGSAWSVEQEHQTSLTKSALDALSVDIFVVEIA